MNRILGQRVNSAICADDILPEGQAVVVRIPTGNRTSTNPPAIPFPASNPTQRRIGPMEIAVGQSFTVPCPFVRDVFVDWDEGGERKSLSWKPGIVWEACGPEDSEPVAHGIGAVIYNVIDVHALPKPYPTRVFFVRQWKRPDGKIFGRKNLHIMTLGTFRARLRGYMFAGHDGREPVLREPDAEQLLKAA